MLLSLMIIKCELFRGCFFFIIYFSCCNIPILPQSAADYVYFKNHFFEKKNKKKMIMYVNNTVDGR